MRLRNCAVLHTMNCMKTKRSTEYDGKNRTLFSLICPCCESEFWVPKNQVKHRKYCSRSCSDAAKRVVDLAVCGTCSSEFRVKPSRRKQSKSGLLFCSRACKDKGQSFRVGLTEIQPPHYSDGRYSGSPRSLLDGQEVPSCITCEDTRRLVLVVHHIDGDHTNNDPSNLEVVCGSCHMLRHLARKGESWYYYPAALTSRDMLESFARM